MSSNHTTLTRLALLFAMIGALALAGCGGDDGVDQSMHDMVVAERDAAAQAQAEAEEKARMEAEAKAEAEEKARMEAEAKAMAEAEAKMAEEARIKAEAAAEAAAQAEMEAEEEARMAEEERMKAAEAQREAEEKARMAEEARMKAEEDAAAAMKAAEAAETQAEMDEAARMMAEADRARLEAANMAARADSLMKAMGAFIEDVGIDYTSRDPAATDPAPVDFASMDAKGDPVANADGETGDEAVSTLNLKADVSRGQRIPSTGDGAPGLAGVSKLTHTADGITAEVAVQAGTKYSVVGYMEQDAGPPAIAGWDGLTLLRRNDADNADQTMYIYTDIGSPETVSFIEKYESPSVNITSHSGNIKDAKSIRFPTRAAEPLVLADEAEVAGTFDGVEGVFTCMGGCAVTYSTTTGGFMLTTGEDAADTRTATTYTGATGAPLAGFLTFKPTRVSDPVNVKGGDDHLYFGYWLHKPDAPGSTHRFMTFAAGMDPFKVRGDNPRTPAIVERDDATGDPGTGGNDHVPEVSLVHQLRGTARFEGPAAGKYVTTDVLVAGDETAIGQFTATAELLADFGLADQPGDVDGVIRDFKGMDGEAMSNWRVTLGNASLMYIGAAPGINEGMTARGVAADDRADNTFNTRTEMGHSITEFVGNTTARIGGGAVRGTWTGQFYGNGRADGNPNAIVGHFDAHGGHASVSGAFGAYNTK